MKKIISVLIMVMLLVLSGCFGENQTDLVYDLEVHFIDVGQGDSIFIKLPNGETMLIDAGDNGKEKVIIEYLTKLKINRIDYIVGTHADADHIGGLDGVIDYFEIGKVYLPLDGKTTSTYLSVLESIDRKGLEIITAWSGMQIIKTKIGEMDLILDILGPVKEYRSNTNDNSVVIKMTYGKSKFLFTGDMEQSAEKDLIATGVDLRADVLKVGHHGSETSTTEQFLSLVNPQIAVIMVGEGNKYNHPHQQILTRLTEKGITIYRTDLMGTIVILSNGNDIKVGDETIIPDIDPEIPIEPQPNTPGLVINEVLVNPSAGKSEWVEIYNGTDHDIDLGGYIIDDIEGGSAPYVIPQGTIIKAGGYYLYIPQSAVFNNDGDSVRLLSPNKELIDEFKYTSSTKDTSFYRITDGGEWSSQPTSSPTQNRSNNPN